MKTVTTGQMRVMDQFAPSYDTSELTLMENAAMAIVREADAYRRIVLFCGKGNNGGDGFAAARLLSRQGKSVLVVLACDPSEITGSARENFDRLAEENIPVLSFLEFDPDTPHDLLIDALLGTGVRGRLTGTYSDMAEYANKGASPVLSVDIPSGVNGDTGQICGTAVRADRTVTFQFAKPGLFLYPGRSHVGELTVADIGMPDECIQATQFDTESTDFSDACALLPPLSPDIHKGDMGRVMLIAGSVGMAGAAYLATEAAVKSGAGLVTLACPASIAEVEMIKLNEAMVLPLPDQDGSLSALATDMLLSEVRKRDAVGMGCGMRNTPDTAHLVHRVIETGISAVLDADALNTLGKHPHEINGKPLILTPHSGEFARLSGLSLAEIEQNRLAVARAFATDHRITLVLKGADTIVAAPDGSAYINMSGNEGMATGGSGDCLTGIISALLGCDMSPKDAARLGVYVHGLAGDIAAKKVGKRALTAGHLLQALSESFHRLEEGILS